MDPVHEYYYRVGTSKIIPLAKVVTEHAKAINVTPANRTLRSMGTATPTKHSSADELLKNDMED